MMGFPGGAVVKNPPDSADLRNAVRSLGQEDPLEKEMASHSNIFAWRILWLAGYSPCGHAELDMTEAT